LRGCLKGGLKYITIKLLNERWYNLDVQAGQHYIQIYRDLSERFSWEVENIKVYRGTELILPDDEIGNFEPVTAKFLTYKHKEDRLVFDQNLLK
jgi:hypothetical protein